MTGFKLVDHRHSSSSDKKSGEKYIQTEQELLNELIRMTLRHSANFTCFLPTDDALWVSCAGEFAYVEFISKSSEPPYWVATRLPAIMEEEQLATSGELVTLPLFDFIGEKQEDDKKKRTKEKLLEFNIGGTPTCFPSSQCVSLQEMIGIVIHFFKHQELSKEFQWQPT